MKSTISWTTRTAHVEANARLLAKLVPPKDKAVHGRSRIRPSGMVRRKVGNPIRGTRQRYTDSDERRGY
jgi:hypothetical protein